MSIQNKPDYKVFASGAKSGEIETFPDILRGWGVTIDRTGEIPPMEWFNAIGKRTDEWLLYLTQRGIPEWNSSLDYPKSAVVTHGDVIYISLRASKGEQPNTTQAAWATLAGFLGLGNYYNKTESNAKFQSKGDYVTNAELNNGLNGKVDKTSVVQTTGTSMTQVMSQKAVTDALSNKQDKGNYLDKSSTSDQVVKGALFGNGEGVGAGNPRSSDTCLLLKTIGVDEPQIVMRESGAAPWLNFRLPKNSGRLGRENRSNNGDSGYLICGDTGLIIQWGSVAASVSQSDFRQFPISFKEGCFQIVSSYAAFGDNGMGTASYPTSKSEFIATNRTHTGAFSSGTVRYIAIGY